MQQPTDVTAIFVDEDYRQRDATLRFGDEVLT
jgi:hypothetical protein